MPDFEKFCKTRVDIIATRDGNREPHGWDHPGTPEPFSYGVVLKHRLSGRCYSCDFHMGSGHVYPKDHHPGRLRGLPKPPTAADVISCLLLDLSTIDHCDSFEEWADELGYDSDSRKAEATWRKLEAEAPKLREFFGDDLEAFQQADQ